MQNYRDDLIRRALDEDLGSGDHSSRCSVPPEARGSMQLLVKEPGVLAGMEVARRVFALTDDQLEFQPLLEDGSKVEKGAIAFRLSGPSQSLLQSERLALNFLQRMSGIATYTARLVKMIEHTSARLLDTRKTTPTLRPLEKEAVRLGGGVNHRMGLYDMIMLKDNHIDFAGGIGAAIEAAQRYCKNKGLELPIEVETRNLKELKEALRYPGIQRVMLDNYSLADTRRAVDIVAGQVETEASGGLDESSLVSYAETGVDFLSVGALTHSVRSLDLSLKAI